MITRMSAATMAVSIICTGNIIPTIIILYFYENVPDRIAVMLTHELKASELMAVMLTHVADTL